MAAAAARRHRGGVLRQGRDRPGHPHGGRADRGRRARRRPRARAHGSRQHGHEPERRRDLGQPVGGAFGLGAALCLRGGARDLSRCRGAATGRGGAEPRGAGRHHRRPRQPPHQLLGAGRRRTCSSAMPPPSIAPKPAAARGWRARPAARLDIPDKVFGRPRFIHDLVLPGMLHARVLRPPSPGATLTALDEPAPAVPGVVAVVRDGSFVGRGGGDRGGGAGSARAAARGAAWAPGEALPDEADLRAWIKSQPVETTPINAREARRRGAGKPARCAARIRGPSWRTPRWRPRAPSPQWSDGRLHVWTHSQGVYNLRADLALVFGLAAREHRRRARRGRGLLRPERRRRRGAGGRAAGARRRRAGP